MTAALKKQVHDIRSQAAHLLERAERLLVELKEVNCFTPDAKAQEKHSENGRRVVSHVC